MDTRVARPTTPTPLSGQLRAGTRDLHAQAERSGIMRGLLHGEVDRETYCTLLRNLQAIYTALEAAIDVHAMHPLIAPVHDPMLCRRIPLEDDLDVLHGADWRDLPVARATRAYVARVEQADPSELVAHVYVRYLGDLSGGQILARIVRETLRLEGAAGTQFYRFAADAKTLAQRLRHGIDELAGDDDLDHAIVEEARWAFSMHVHMFEELGAR